MICAFHQPVAYERAYPTDCLVPPARRCYDPPMTMRALFAAAAWLSLVAIGVFTLTPISYRPVVADQHLEHVAAFVVVGVLFGLAYPRHMVMITVVVIGAAILLELLQLLVPGRHARTIDAALKLVSACAGLAVAFALNWWHARQ